MPFVAIWNCSVVDAWRTKTLDQRITALHAAVFTANVEAKMKSATADWIFVAPEYAFAAPAVHGMTYPAVHVTALQEGTFRNALSAISEKYPTLVLAPGTIVVTDAPNRGRNTGYGYRNNAQLWRVDKRTNVSEVPATMTFQAGTGQASANVGGTTYGMEICADATGGGTLPAQVNRHIVVGAGVGHAAIANKALDVQIVADGGNYSVTRYNNGNGGTAVRSYKSEKSLDVPLYYYVV